MALFDLNTAKVPRMPFTIIMARLYWVEESGWKRLRDVHAARMRSAMSVMKWVILRGSVLNAVVGEDQDQDQEGEGGQNQDQDQGHLIDQNDQGHRIVREITGRGREIVVVIVIVREIVIMVVIVREIVIVVVIGSAIGREIVIERKPAKRIRTRTKKVNEKRKTEFEIDKENLIKIVRKIAEAENVRLIISVITMATEIPNVKQNPRRKWTQKVQYAMARNLQLAPQTTIQQPRQHPKLQTRSHPLNPIRPHLPVEPNLLLPLPRILLGTAMQANHLLMTD